MTCDVTKPYVMQVRGQKEKEKVDSLRKVTSFPPAPPGGSIWELQHRRSRSDLVLQHHFYACHAHEHLF